MVNEIPLATREQKKARFIDLLYECSTDEDIRRIVRTAINQARRGNWRARQWIWENAVGKPKQMVDFGDADAPFVRLLMNWLAKGAVNDLPEERPPKVLPSSLEDFAEMDAEIEEMLGNEGKEGADS